MQKQKKEDKYVQQNKPQEFATKCWMQKSEAKEFYKMLLSNSYII